MLRLEATLKAWDMPDFKTVLRDELVETRALERPMQLGLTYGTVALPEGLKFVVLEAHDDDTRIRIHGGVHYSSVTTGSNCIDAPSPLSEMPEYVEVDIVIDRATADATVSLAAD
ncbi:MAG: hypothetical protein FNT29_10835 [Halothiobacillaceae bacterium]|nr:MAG: hypothetical protein FNT29_10835 [Halothiobacillaceae bacterium]